MRHYIKCILTYTMAGLLATFVLLPLYWMVSTSLRPTPAILKYPPELLPRAFSTEHYRELVESTEFLSYFLNSMAVATSVVLIVGITAFLGGYSLSRYSFVTGRIIAFSSLLGYMIAPVMIVIPFYIMARTAGIANTHLALVLAHTSFCFPFALWLMKAYIDDIPVELEKAAQIDGASRWAGILHIVLPLASPGLTAVGIFTFILSWNDYVFARILITGNRLKTIPVGLEDIYNSTVTNWGLLMAAGVLITVPILIGFVFVQRMTIVGLNETGFKA